jgi:two-component system, LuxR family, response regulator FixJ
MAKSKATGKTSAQSEFSQPKKRKPFTVFLIVDDQTMRQSLVEILKSEKIDVQDYMTAMEFYRDYRESKPGVVISELNLRGMTGIELAEKLIADKKDMLFTLLAGHADAPVAVKAMQENVLDFLLKPVKAESLLGLVARAYAQYYDVDWDFVGDDLQYIEDSLNRITQREREVLDLLVEGYSSREIGSQLGVSTKTIEAHRSRINDKMRCDDLGHLVRMVLASRDA